MLWVAEVLGQARSAEKKNYYFGRFFHMYYLKYRLLRG